MHSTHKNTIFSQNLISDVTFFHTSSTAAVSSYSSIETQKRRISSGLRFSSHMIDSAQEIDIIKNTPGT